MRALTPGTAPLVARDAELTTLLAACQQAFNDRRPAVVLLLGEAGAGKSRLIREIASRLEADQGARVLGGFAMPGEGHPPYFALGRAIRRLARAGHAERTLSPAKLALLATAELWPGERTEALSHLNAAEGRIRLLETLSELLMAVTEQEPVAIVLDDMQWATGADWDAIAYVARAVEGPLAFVVAARPDVEDSLSPATPALAELNRNRLVHRLQLRPLDGEAVEALLSALLGEPASVELLTLVRETTHGNPFLIEELCTRLDAEGGLLATGGEWRLSPTAPLVPDAASFTLAARLRALAAGVRGLVEVAAILGREGTPRELAQVLARAPETVTGQLAAAQQAGLLDSVGNGDGWSFPHDIVREAIARGVEAPGEIHRRIALALSARPEARPRAVALHWAAAGEPVEAARVAITAAAEAAARFAPQEALELARFAVVQATLATPCAGEGVLAQAQAAFADAALDAGEWHTADEAYNRLESIAARTGDELLVGRARVGLGLAARRLERPDDAVLHLRAGIHALQRQPGAVSHIARARITLATVYGLTQANYRLAETEATAAVDEARSLGDAALESEALLALANSRVRSVGPATAREDLESALERALAGHQLQVAAEAAASLSNNYYWTGELRRAQHFGHVRLDVATRANDTFGLRHGRSWLALLAASAGRWEEALSLLREDEAWLESLESPEPAAFASVVTAFVHFRTGDFQQAYVEASGALALLSPLGDGTLLWYASLLALVCVAAGRREEALSIAAAQDARLRAVDDTALPARSARCALGLVYVRLGMAAEAADCEARLRPFAGDYHWWPVRLALAEAGLLRGDTAGALADIDAALALTRREGQRADTALLLEARSRALGPGSPQSRSALEEARTIARAIGLHLRGQEPVRDSSPPMGLTRREVEVLKLVAEGLSNHDIAERLVLSERTVVNHVSHIFDKLDVDSRSAATAWAIRTGLA